MPGLPLAPFSQSRCKGTSAWFPTQNVPRPGPQGAVGTVVNVASVSRGRSASLSLDRRRDSQIQI
ncbi:hypothetical protein EYF80_067537 [Liparis tanakae]|uniref:Uncharacterized protein n=1 Tax=Liparis tanakae TaxID=230148 RepID=A0A4Z2E0U2_9TELE|nr:hypothetical protein EYF80_067537 [Liparis tanakae]